MQTSLGACGAASAPTDTSGGGFVGASQTLEGSQCNGLATSSQGPGFASAFSSVIWNTSAGDSGFLRADASAAIVSEGLTPDFDNSELTELGAVLYSPIVSFTATVAAKSSLAAANVSYQFSFAGNSVEGSMRQSADGIFGTQTVSSQVGQFGVVELPAVEMLRGTRH